MTEETQTESAVSEPAVEPASAPEPIVESVTETPIPDLAQTPENGSNGTEGVEMGEPLTAQPDEPLVTEPISEPTPTPEAVPEPIPTPEPSPASTEPASAPGSTSIPQPQVSTPVSTPSTGSQQASSPQAPIIQTSLARELLIKAREMIQFRKRKKLEKIMSLFLKQSSITNDDVQKLLYVSDATATRYLDQLEREGKIKRENAGKYLSYSRM